MTYPKFIGIGAPRAGTTWLYAMLLKHPNISLPPLKELHYFDVIDPSVNRNSYRFGPHLKSRTRHNLGAAASLLNVPLKKKPVFNPSWDLRYFSGQFNEKWYRRLFRKEHKLGMVTGEITPSYSLLSAEYINSIISINNEMKFIYILRDPVDRSWSHAVKIFSRDKGVPLKDVPTESLIKFFQSDENICCGSYAKNIKNYLSVIDSRNLLIIYFDDIKTDPANVLSKIYSFIGVSKIQDMDENILNKPVNASSFGCDVPDIYTHLLSNIFRDDVEALCKMYTGWPDVWLERVESNLQTYRSVQSDTPI